MPKIKAAIFDMDGLMFDTESLFYIAHTQLSKKRNKEFSREVHAKMMGRKPLHAIEILLSELGLEDDPREVVIERDAHYEELMGTSSETMPGLMKLLDFLETKNIRKAIASGSNHSWIQFLLNKFEIKDRFELIVSGEDVEHGKPSPDIYLKAASDLRLMPNECVVFEDALNGIKAAKSAGCFAVAVPSDFTKHQDFSEADLVIDSLNDDKLLAIFK